MKNWLGLPIENLTSIWQVAIAGIIYTFAWATTHSISVCLINKIKQLILTEIVPSSLKEDEPTSIHDKYTIQLCRIYRYIEPLIEDDSKTKIIIPTIITWSYLRFWILKTCGNCFLSNNPIAVSIILLILIASILFILGMFLPSKK